MSVGGLSKGRLGRLRDVMAGHVERGEVPGLVTFKSRAHRDRVNAKVMKDKRLAGSMDPKSMPFDVKRMIYGGFTVLVDL